MYARHATRNSTAPRQQWPAGANTGPVHPLYVCHCGATSSAGHCPRGH